MNPTRWAGRQEFANMSLTAGLLAIGPESILTNVTDQLIEERPVLLNRVREQKCYDMAKSVAFFLGREQDYPRSHRNYRAPSQEKIALNAFLERLKGPSSTEKKNLVITALNTYLYTKSKALYLFGIPGLVFRFLDTFSYALQTLLLPSVTADVKSANIAKTEAEAAEKVTLKRRKLEIITQRSYPEGYAAGRRKATLQAANPDTPQQELNIPQFVRPVNLDDPSNPLLNGVAAIQGLLPASALNRMTTIASQAGNRGIALAYTAYNILPTFIRTGDEVPQGVADGNPASRFVARYITPLGVDLLQSFEEPEQTFPDNNADLETSIPYLLAKKATLLLTGLELTDLNKTLLKLQMPDSKFKKELYVTALNTHIYACSKILYWLGIPRALFFIAEHFQNFTQRHILPKIQARIDQRDTAKKEREDAIYRESHASAYTKGHNDGLAKGREEEATAAADAAVANQYPSRRLANYMKGVFASAVESLNYWDNG